MGFYLGLFFQLMGLAAVSLCLVSGLTSGDYGRLELVQFVGGFLVFYLGQFLKSKASS